MEGTAAMFKVNDVIVYGMQGVCKIVDIEEKNISGKQMRYFVVKPVNDQGSTIFAPTDNEAVLKKMRKLLSVEEINALIDSMPEEKQEWITNMNERRDYFKGILASGEPAKLIQMIKSIYAHKTEREADGKRLPASDEQIFKDAEKVLYHEFQYVLQLESKNDLMRYILSRIENQNC